MTIPVPEVRELSGADAHAVLALFSRPEPAQAHRQYSAHALRGSGTHQEWREPLFDSLGGLLVEDLFDTSDSEVFRQHFVSGAGFEAVFCS